MGAISFRLVAACSLRALQPIIETESDLTTDRLPSKRQALVLKRRRRTSSFRLGPKSAALAFCRLTLPWGPWPPELEAALFLVMAFLEGLHQTAAYARHADQLRRAPSRNPAVAI